MTKRIIRISYFTMLTMIGGFLRIPIGSVNFTLQTVFVVLSGLVLGAKDGALSQITYLILGFLGLPIFTSGGGFSYVFQPTFGYILAFPLGSAFSAIIFYKLKSLSVTTIFSCALVGLLPVYVVGVSYQMMIFVNVLGMTFKMAILTTVSIAIYFVIDVLLCCIIALIYPKISNLIGPKNLKNE